MAGADACISLLGGRSLKKRSPEITGGIANIVNVMEQAGVKRLIYLSSIGAGDSRYYMGPLLRLFIVGILLRVPLADHTTNEKRIAGSTLQWTIVRPMGLSNGEKTGKIRHGSDFIKITGSGRLSRADVAAFILGQVVSETYINRKVWLLA
jgi:putative NADH-flavin reductase